MRSKLLIGVLGAAMAVLFATPLVAQAAGFINSADIINNTVKSADLKNDGVKSRDIRNNTITGTDVNEATLVGVNASTLNALPGSAYLNTVYNFGLPTAAASTNKVFAAAVPPGTYVVNYNVIATGSSPRCAILARTDVPSTGFGFQDGFGNGGFFMSSGHAVITVAAGQTPAIWCFSGANFSVYNAGDGQSTASFQKVDTLVSGNATGGREGAAGKSGALTR